MDGYTNSLLQILRFTGSLKVFVSNKPFFRTGLWMITIVSSHSAMDATPLFEREVGKGKIAYLWMNGIDTPIKLHKRSLHKLITGRTPILSKLGGNSFTDMDLLLLGEYIIAFMKAMDTFQAYNIMRRSQRFGGKKHDDLLMAKGQSEG